MISLLIGVAALFLAVIAGAFVDPRPSPSRHADLRRRLRRQRSCRVTGGSAAPGFVWRAAGQLDGQRLGYLAVRREGSRAGFWGKRQGMPHVLDVLLCD